MKKSVLAFLAAMALFMGCQGESKDLGVVARVNDRPIYLSQLEYQHDLLHLDRAAGVVPTVALLRKEYGEILGDLIVQELVLQDIEARGLEVTDQELKDAEDLIRADYPDGAFEQVLIEEYIDLNSWRRQLKYKLALDKFTQLVLRPHIKIDYKEAQDYYRKHIAEFYLPERIKILVVNGPSKELVNRAVQILQRDNNATLDSEDLKQVSAREIVASRERLSEQWQKALLGVGQGQATRILSDENRFERLVLLERHPARLLDPSQAYPLVEEALLDHKLQKAFEDWLARALEDAVVSISEQLLPGAEEADPGQAQGQAQEQVPDQVREEVQEGPREPALEELQEQAPEQAQEQAQEPPPGEVQDESNAAPGQ